MDGMDNFRERIEVLEQQEKAMRAHTRTVERRLRWWRGMACGLLIVGLVSLPLPSGTARPEHDSTHNSVILYTPVLPGDTFGCNVVNVSNKDLGITIAILGADGKPLCPDPSSCANPSSEVSVQPGAIATIDVSLEAGTADDGYCKVEVFGTDKRKDVRVDLNGSRTRTFGTPPIPVFIFKVVEGH